MNFLIAYDIADPKRLKAVAKSLETLARRIQKSVFIFHGTRAELDMLIVAAVQHIEAGEDRIQSWPIRTSTRSIRTDCGTAIPENAISLVMGIETSTLIEAIDDDALHGQSDEQYLID